MANLPNRMPTNEELNGAAGIIIDPTSKEFFTCIPLGELTAEKVQSMLPPSTIVEVFVKYPNSADFQPYSIVRTPSIPSAAKKENQD